MPAARTIRSERDRLDDPACRVPPGVLGSTSRSLTRDTHQRERRASTWPFSTFRATSSQCGPGKRCRSCSVAPFSLGSRICVRLTAGGESSEGSDEQVWVVQFALAALLKGFCWLCRRGSDQCFPALSIAFPLDLPARGSHRIALVNRRRAPAAVVARANSYSCAHSWRKVRAVLVRAWLAAAATGVGVCGAGRAHQAGRGIAGGRPMSQVVQPNSALDRGGLSRHARCRGATGEPVRPAGQRER